MPKVQSTLARESWIEIVFIPPYANLNCVDSRKRVVD